jgi:hypothetical protein
MEHVEEWNKIVGLLYMEKKVVGSGEFWSRS